MIEDVEIISFNILRICKQ